MVRHTFKILQQMLKMLQDFKIMSEHFLTLCIKGLIFECYVDPHHVLRKIIFQEHSNQSFVRTLLCLKFISVYQKLLIARFVFFKNWVYKNFILEKKKITRN